MTRLAQEVAGAKYKKAGFATLWGHPSPSQRMTCVNMPSLRGMSNGVATLATCPSMPAIEELPRLWSQTCRIMECFVQLQHVVVKIITVYGWQSSIEDSREMTSSLLGAALSRAKMFPGLSVIGGDINHHPESLAVWPEMAAAGFVNVLTVAKARWPNTTFPTCRDSTYHDTLLIPRDLLAHLSKVEVHIDKKFDCHAPMSAHFSIPVNGLFRSAWTMPKTWEDLSIQADKLASDYTALLPQAKFDQLLELAATNPNEAYLRWCRAVEKAVGKAADMSNFDGIGAAPVSNGRLARAFSGRGKLPKVTKKMTPTIARVSSSHAYMPLCEDQPILLRQKTKQVRRISALLSRLRKWERVFGPIHDAVIQHHEQHASFLQIQSEWHAVVHSPGYAGTFLEWVASPERLGFRFNVIPRADGLALLLQFAKDDCNALAAKIKAKRKQAFQLRIRVDFHSGTGAFVFKLLRPRSNPPLEFLTVKEEMTLTPLKQRLTQKGPAMYRVKPAGVFNEDMPLELGEHKCYATFVNAHEGIIRLLPDADFPGTADSLEKLVREQGHAKVRRCKLVCDPTDISTRVHDFWCQYWQREDGADSPFPSYDDALSIFLKTLRLARCEQPLAAEFWDLAKTYEDFSGPIHGPSKVFAFACHKLGWLIAEDFILMVSPGVALNLKCTDKADLKFHLDRAWAKILRQHLVHKVQLHDLAPIDLSLTRAAYLKLHVNDRKLMLYHMSGAIQTNLVRAEYQNISEQCNYCEHRDTVRHRHFDCPVSEEVRQTWQDHVPTFGLLPTAQFHVSVCVEHPQFELALAGNYLRQLEVDLPTTDEPLLVYTDGSFDPTAGRVVSRAGFSVVTLPKMDSDTIEQLAATYRSSGAVPDFNIAYVGLVQGRQTNNRGELSAIVRGLMTSLDVELVIDSQYSLDLVERVISNPVPSAYRHLQNYDLVLILIQLLSSVQHRNIRLRKVKSHLTVDDSHSAAMVLDILGNAFADETAKLCVQHHSSAMDDVQVSVDNASIQQFRTMCLLQQFQVAVAREFNKAWKSTPQVEVVDALSERVAKLEGWPVASVLQSPVPVFTQSIRDACYFTSTYTWALVNWLAQLQWPQTLVEGDPGVTGIELYMSFQLYTGMVVPYNLAKEGHNVPQYVCAEQDPAVKMLPRTKIQELRVFEFSLKYAAKLFGQQLVPMHWKTTVRTLNILGNTRHSWAGFQRRPRFPGSQLVLETLSKKLEQGYIKAFGMGHVEMPTFTPMQRFPLQPEDNERSSFAGFQQILVTQPRRIAAVSLARRVAAEQMDAQGGRVVGQRGA
eukprot:Skav222141  [mRNA]  locus=scaffold1181:1085966:1091954:- [translate_table: standard]